MSEYFRTSNYGGNKFQWVDSRLCMVLDTITGKPEKISGQCIVPVIIASEYVRKYKKGWEDRTVIVFLDCIQGFKINE